MEILLWRQKKKLFKFILSLQLVDVELSVKGSILLLLCSFRTMLRTEQFLIFYFTMFSLYTTTYPNNADKTK